MLQPNIPEQSIIAFLIQDQLSISSHSWIDLSVLVEIRSIGPGAVAGMQIKNGALANVNEEADVLVASEMEGNQYPVQVNEK